MKKQTYLVNGKEYSEEALVSFGKKNESGFYWIPRMIGITLMFSGLFFIMLIGIAMLILFVVGVFEDPEFPIWAFYIPLGVFGLILLSGIILFIISFNMCSRKRYIEYALSYLTKYNTSLEERILSDKDIEDLKRYKRLLDGGVISQEEYDKARKNILNP